MPYKVEKTVTLDGSPYQGAEVDVVSVDGSQSLGRSTTDASGTFNINVGEYTGAVFASVYIDGIKPQVKKFIPELIPISPESFSFYIDATLSNGDSTRALNKGYSGGQLVRNNSNWNIIPDDFVQISSFSGNAYCFSVQNDLATFGDLTLAAKVKPFSGGSGTILEFIGLPSSNSQDQNRLYAFGVLPATDQIFYERETGNGVNERVFIDSPIQINANETYDVALTRDQAGAVTFYINGSLIGSIAITPPTGGGSADMSLWHGHRSAGSLSGAYYKLIADNKVWAIEDIQTGLNL